MIVATWTVNSIRARMPIVVAWIDRVQPDLLCLQETRVDDPQFPGESLEALGYHLAFRGGKGRNGVAVLSRAPIEEVHVGIDDGGPPDEDRLLMARVGGVPIVNTYVPQGRDPDHPMFAVKLAWFERLRAFFERRFNPEGPLLWVGDLNVAPLPIDVHDPVRLDGQIGYHPRERDALAETASWGFVDVFRRHVTDGGQYTFYDYRARDPVSRGIGWRVDHILATAPLAERSTAAWIDTGPRVAERPSDHTPLVAEFRGHKP
ncbi:MAG: exodeoxyribonuclease III [Candidatus Bipolaricaulota bacterium]|nr:MAG: exodeoxyribonuclease III [Candidatus Bipolaricaulota bacterium]